MEKNLRDRWVKALRSKRFRQVRGHWTLWPDLEGAPVACGNGVLQFLIARDQMGKRAYATQWSKAARLELLQRAERVQVNQYVDGITVNAIIRYNDENGYTYEDLARWIEKNVDDQPFAPFKPARRSMFVKTPEQEAADVKASTLMAVMPSMWFGTLEASLVSHTWDHVVFTTSATVKNVKPPKPVAKVEHGKFLIVEHAVSAAKNAVPEVETEEPVGEVPMLEQEPAFDVIFNEGLWVVTSKVLVPDHVPEDWVAEVMLSA